MNSALGFCLIALANSCKLFSSVNQSSSCISLIHSPFAMRIASFQFSGVPSGAAFL